MLGSELDKVLQIVSKNYIGHFARDELPNLDEGEYCIINLAPKIDPGTHWIVIGQIYSAENSDSGVTEFEYFDSLGTNPKKVYEFFDTESVVHFNHIQVQSSNSSTCGMFCCYFILNRLENLDLDFHTLFNLIFDPRNKTLNEAKVKDFF